MTHSCQQNKANSDTNIKKKFYKILSKDNQLLSYNYRVYHFDNDTIQEKCVTISLDGKVKGSFTKNYLIKGSKIFILFKIDSKTNKMLYFSTEKIDSCYNVYQKFDKAKICYNGLISNGKYKDVYKVYYEEIDYDGSIQELIIDKDFTLISRFCKNNNYKKEILINSSEVLEKVKTTANNI